MKNPQAPVSTPTVDVVLFGDCDTFDAAMNCSIMRMPDALYQKVMDGNLEPKFAVRESTECRDLGTILEEHEAMSARLAEAEAILKAVLVARDRAQMDRVRVRAHDWVHPGLDPLA